MVTYPAGMGCRIRKGFSRRWESPFFLTLLFIVRPLFLCSHYESISGRLEGFSGLLPAILQGMDNKPPGRKEARKTSENGFIGLFFSASGCLSGDNDYYAKFTGCGSSSWFFASGSAAGSSAGVVSGSFPGSSDSSAPVVSGSSAASG